LRGKQLAGVTFRRQHALGRYVVDFCSPRHRLVIELDGSSHQQTADADQARTMELEAQGYRVLRFWNREVIHDLGRVVQRIRDALTLA
jgi:very-short-patch-repair endonuclease